MEIISGRQTRCLKVVLYGVEGIGKSTLASQFPSPIFIDVEGGTAQLSVDRLTPTTWEEVFEAVTLVAEAKRYKTLVIDTIDWAERLCASALCKEAHQRSIEDFPYGKGYTFVAERMRSLLQHLDPLINQGMHVVLLAHAKMSKFEAPEGQQAYDRWSLNLMRQTTPLVKEWADLLLFANYEIFTVQTQTGKAKAQGGERVMHTAHHPCWDAKNRVGLEPKLPLEYTAIAWVFEPENQLEARLIESGITPEALSAFLHQNQYLPSPTTPLAEYPITLIHRVVNGFERIEASIKNQRS